MKRRGLAVAGRHMRHIEPGGPVVRDEIGLELTVVRQLILGEQTDDRLHAEGVDVALRRSSRSSWSSYSGRASGNSNIPVIAGQLMLLRPSRHGFGLSRRRSSRSRRVRLSAGRAADRVSSVACYSDIDARRR